MGPLGMSVVKALLDIEVNPIITSFPHYKVFVTVGNVYTLSFDLGLLSCLAWEAHNMISENTKRRANIKIII